MGEAPGSNPGESMFKKAFQGLYRPKSLPSGFLEGTIRVGSYFACFLSHVFLNVCDEIASLFHFLAVCSPVIVSVQDVRRNVIPSADDFLGNILT